MHFISTSVIGTRVVLPVSMLRHVALNTRIELHPFVSSATTEAAILDLKKVLGLLILLWSPLEILECANYDKTIAIL